MSTLVSAVDVQLPEVALVSKEELTQAVRSLDLTFGGLTEVADFSSKPVPNQGTISLILQVTAQINVPVNGASNEVEKKTVTLIAKRLPVIESLRKKNIDNRLLEREGNFFKDAVPLIRSRCSQLQIPNCYFSSPHVIYLQDVSLLGYSNISESDLKHCHSKLVIDKLAKFHASTLNINWFEALPHISFDCVFEATDKALYQTFCKACKNYTNVIHNFYPENNQKYLKLLSNENDVFYNILLKFIKPSLKYLNVLTHGDCWTNNILFKLNSKTNLPEDLYFIDFPYARFVPPSRDLQYFLYNCTNSKFRDEHEFALLKRYVEVFNDSSHAFFGDSSQTLLFEDFYKEYSASRLYGICMALMFRTFGFLIPKLCPKERTDEDGKMSENIINLCKLDQVLNEEIRLIAEEFMKIVDAFDFDSYC